MNDIVRPAWADIDLDVIENNVHLLRQKFAPAELCAVVKADGYGHGAVEVARAAVRGGASRLAVALVEEGRLLRQHNVRVPILLLSAAESHAWSEVVEHDITPSVYSVASVKALASAVSKAGRSDHPVHVKVDTGMHRVGVDPARAFEVIDAVLASDVLRWEGLWTHFAVADEPDDRFTNVQAQRFDELVEKLSVDRELPPLIHTSNTAGGVAFPAQRRSLVRCGVGIYGVAPSSEVELPDGVAPAMRVHTTVAFVQRLQAGEAISYGLSYKLDRPSNIAVIPVGYADGVFRILSFRGGQVLVNGKRYPIAGAVTMDQTMIDCGDDEVFEGDEVVLIGTQGDQEVSATDWAKWCDTIGYEVICRIGPRLPRRYLHS